MYVLDTDSQHLATTQTNPGSAHAEVNTQSPGGKQGQNQSYFQHISLSGATECYNWMLATSATEWKQREQKIACPSSSYNRGKISC